MAVGTITKVLKSTVIGNLRVTITDVVGSASYTTSGDALTPANLGLSKTVLYADVQTSSGWVGKYDITNSKLLVYGDGANTGTTTTSTALPQAASTTNVSAATFRVVAIGF